jgi:hypothetical protein
MTGLSGPLSRKKFGLNGPLIPKNRAIQGSSAVNFLNASAFKSYKDADSSITLTFFSR